METSWNNHPFPIRRACWSCCRLVSWLMWTWWWVGGSSGATRPFWGPGTRSQLYEAHLQLFHSVKQNIEIASFSGLQFSKPLLFTTWWKRRLGRSTLMELKAIRWDHFLAQKRRFQLKNLALFLNSYYLNSSSWWSVESRVTNLLSVPHNLCLPE